MAGARTHDDLPGLFPGAESVECDGHGNVNITYPADEPAQYLPRSARCPACEHAEMMHSVSRWLPPRFRGTIPIPAALQAWASHGRKAQGAYLTGPVGTGKTHAAWMAVRAWCETAQVTPRKSEYNEMTGNWTVPAVVFTRMTDLLDDLRPGDDARKRVRDCQNTGLLVLDDIGAEKSSEWTQERIYSIVDHRYAGCLPLIVTSNLPPADLAGQIGERAASRLAEMCEVIPLTGDDRRLPS